MPALSPYKSELDYAYAPGIFPAMECLLHRADCAGGCFCIPRPRVPRARRSSSPWRGATMSAWRRPTRPWARVSGKENCFAAVVFTKFQDTLNGDKPHVVLHNPSDCGNVGTILRTALGFGVEDVALIRPWRGPVRSPGGACQHGQHVLPAPKGL